MRTTRIMLFVAALVFAVVALAHLHRVFFPFEIELGTSDFPIWGSALVYLGAGILSCYLFRAFRQSKQRPTE